MLHNQEVGPLLNEKTDELLSDASETDIDEMIGNLKTFKEAEGELRSKRIEIETRLAVIALSIQGEGKTRRVAGKEHCVKVTLKTETKWDQKQLGQIRGEIGDSLFFNYFAEEYKPKNVGLKKLKSSAGEPEKLWHELCKAMTEIQGKPYVEIEK